MPRYYHCRGAADLSAVLGRVQIVYALYAARRHVACIQGMHNTPRSQCIMPWQSLPSPICVQSLYLTLKLRYGSTMFEGSCIQRKQTDKYGLENENLIASRCSDHPAYRTMHNLAESSALNKHGTCGLDETEDSGTLEQRGTTPSVFQMRSRVLARLNTIFAKRSRSRGPTLLANHRSVGVACGTIVRSAVARNGVRMVPNGSAIVILRSSLSWPVRGS